jgi:DNA polymerase-3 subunit delta
MPDELTYQTASRQLHPDRIAPIYLVYGEERFFIDKLVSWFLEKMVSVESRDFNYNRFVGETAKPSEILLAAKSVPMIGDKRLIVIEDADGVKDPEGQLLAYLASPTRMTVIIFVVKKPDMRTKLFAALKKQGIIIHCRPLYESELPGFIQSEGKRLGMTLLGDSVSFLAEHIGKNLTLLYAELTKLSLHLGQQKEREVTLDTVLQVVSGEKAYTIFDWVNAVAEKDLKNALLRLAFMLADGEAPLKMLAMLLWQFRMMAIAKELILSRPSADVGKQLSLPPYRVAPFLERLSLWQSDEIRRAFDLFKEADLQLKGSRVSHSILLEDLIFKICKRKAFPLRKGGC